MRWGMLVYLGVGAVVVMMLQIWLCVFTSDRLNLTVMDVCYPPESDTVFTATPDMIGLACDGVRRNYTGYPSCNSGYPGYDCMNYTSSPDYFPVPTYNFSGVTVTTGRWDDLGYWFIWNVLLAVIDAAVAVAAFGWRHILMSKDDRLKKSIESVVDYGTSAETEYSLPK